MNASDPHFDPGALGPERKDESLKTAVWGTALFFAVSGLMLAACLWGLARMIPRPEPMAGEVTLLGSLPPGDASDAVAAYAEQHSALWKGDAEKLFPPESGLPRWLIWGVRAAIPMLRAITPREVRVTGVTVHGDRAVLEVEGTLFGAESRGTIAMVKGEGGWRTVSSQWSSGTSR